MLQEVFWIKQQHCLYGFSLSYRHEYHGLSSIRDAYCPSTNRILQLTYWYNLFSFENDTIHFISCLILLSWENLNIWLFRVSFQYKFFWQPKSILRRCKEQNMAVVLTHSPLKPWVCSSHTISGVGLQRGGNPKARNSVPWLHGWLVTWP